MTNLNIFEKTVKFQKNQVIYNSGDLSPSFYYILNGSVNLYEIHGKSKVFLKNCPIMSTFGVDEFISEEPRKQMAIASENSEFIEITSYNIEEFSSQLPGVVLNILNNLSCDIKYLNDLLLLKEKNLSSPISHGSVNFIYEEDKVYIESDRKYPLLLPDVHKDYLYEADRTCPVCSYNFKTNNVRLSHMIFLGEDEDLRIRYKDINPLWYQLLTCPKCNYINFRQTFTDLKTYLIDPVKQALEKQKKINTLSIKISINDVFEEYYHFLRLIYEYKYSDLAKARIWESLMWLYDDAGDRESYELAKVQYTKSLKDGWYNDSDSLSAENESLITYKLALLELEKNNLKDAHIFCMRALQVKGISFSHKRRVQNKLYEISELNRKKQSNI